MPTDPLLTRAMPTRPGVHPERDLPRNRKRRPPAFRDLYSTLGAAEHERTQKSRLPPFLALMTLTFWIVFVCVCGLLAVMPLGVLAEAPGPVVRVERLGDGPIIDRDTFARAGVADQPTGNDKFPAAADNINGPSVIRVADWMRERLRDTPVADANYLLYFAHHRDVYIRLAWAERIDGPWQLYNPRGREHPEGLRGVLDLGERRMTAVGNHLMIKAEAASPDVHVDAERRRVVMYFHAATKGGQKTFVATSHDGLNFNTPADGNHAGHGVRPVKLGDFYFRVFEHEGQAYAFCNFGYLYRAPDGAGATDDAAWATPPGFDHREQDLWTRIDGPIRTNHDHDPARQADDPRHFALLKQGDRLDVFFTRRRDRPERIVLSTMDLSADDWTAWSASHPPQTILEPQQPWEGAELPLTLSANGAATGVRQLRDPYIFTDADGSRYLFYTGRGESAIGVARLEMDQSPPANP